MQKNYDVIKLKRERYSFDFGYFLKGINSSIDQSVQSMQYASEFYNFSNEKGVLQTGLGLKELTFYSKVVQEEVGINPLSYEGNIVNLYTFSYYDDVAGEYVSCLIAYTTANKLYSLAYTTISRVFIDVTNNGMIFTQKPLLQSYLMQDMTERLLVSTKDEGLNVIDIYGDVEKAISAPQIRSMCVHYDRVFAITSSGENAVWFSDDLNPVNWNASLTEGGWIGINDDLGECNKIISFNGYVYIFRSYGITRLTAFAEQETFSLFSAYTSSMRIFASTACICGGLVYFLASDGFYCFDGVNVSKVNVGFEKLFLNLKQENAKAVYYKNSYYIILNTTLSEIHSDSRICNTLIRFDCIDGTYDILKGVQLIDIEALKARELEKLVCVEMIDYIDQDNFQTRLSEVDYIGQVHSIATKKTWLSPLTDLNQGGYSKNITNISMQTLTDCTVTVITERGQASVKFCGAEVSQQKPLFISGVMVQIRIDCEEKEANISHPIIEYSLGNINAR